MDTGNPEIRKTSKTHGDIAGLSQNVEKHRGGEGHPARSVGPPGRSRRPAGTPKSIKKSTKKQCLQSHPKSSKTEPRRVQKSTKIDKNRGPETTLKKHSKKVPKLSPSDPQKQWFRIAGITKITKSAGRQKVTKMSPKLTPKST